MTLSFKEKYLPPVMIWLLTFTPLLALLAPRALAWWPAVLGLMALTLTDRNKTPLWVTASVPLWAGTLSLVSVIWSAFPTEALELVIGRLPMLYGLSAGIIGLSVLRHDVWAKALPRTGWVFAVCVFLAFIEYSFDYPFNHMLFVQTGETNLKLETAAIMNRALTALLLFAVPCVWALWHKGHQKIGLFAALILLGTLAVSEASATFLAALAGLLVYALASWKPRCTKYLMIGGTMLLLCTLPFLAPWAFAHRPVDWSYLNTPSTGGRLEIWDFVGRAIQQRPSVGYGYEATRFYPFESAEIYFKQSTVLHPHNAALQIWMEFGAIGAAFALLGLTALGRQLKSAPAMMLATFVIIMGLLSFGIWQGTWLGLIGIAALYWRAAATVFGSKIQ